MKLFWSSRSPFVRKVMIVAHELGLAEELTLIRSVVHPAAPNADVMVFNPLSKIPTLVFDNGTPLYDSRVICEYLDTDHGQGRLVPPAGQERWRVLTWQAMADGIMETALLWLSEKAKPSTTRQDDIVSGCRQKIFAALDRLEDEGRFISSTEPTLGHIAVGSALLYLDFRFDAERWRDARPRLGEWFEAFSRRASVRATAFADVY